MGKPIATTACVLLTDAQVATCSITTPPSTKVMAGGNPCYSGTLDVKIENAIQGGLTQTAPIVATIIGTSTKVMIEGKPAVLEGDKSMPMVVPAQNPKGDPMTFPITVSIISAGQVKATAS